MSNQSPNCMPSINFLVSLLSFLQPLLNTPLPIYSCNMLMQRKAHFRGVNNK
ncbi:hypothetical protein GLYMA_03G100102v4 [Glycine max]|nr:hypothetical protein GLYMA_03G100102v4 [Glycine max]